MVGHLANGRTYLWDTHVRSQLLRADAPDAKSRFYYCSLASNTLEKGRTYSGQFRKMTPFQ